VGEPLAIVSPKPQTTRETVAGVLTEGDTQIIFQDTAGLLDPSYALHRAMIHSAAEALRGADLVLHLHPCAAAPAPPLQAVLEEARVGDLGLSAQRVLTVYTMSDQGGERWRRDERADRRETLAVSALTGEGIAALIEAIRARLPEGPFHYPPDDVGTQSLRFFAAEFVREAAFAELEQELPYSLAVTVDEFRESSKPVYIRATVAVERESQKPIVLGAGGRTIKAIGTAARRRLEALIGNRVHLELWVTVWPKWRKDPQALARLGLPLPKPENA
jgi:GTP-binding protein Era